MNAADIAWVLVASALVWLMVPGLALFYGGFSDQKTIVNTLAMVLVAIAVGGVAWFVLGYSLAFGGDGPIVGNLNHAFFQNISMTQSTKGLTIPDGAFALFQGMFPMITMAIIAGAVVGRMNFKAFLMFLVLWILVVYAPLAHMVWGGGVLSQWHALDFAGGDVVHISSGVSALVLALMVGKRRHVTELTAQNMPAIVLGAGLLWFGWFGFNAGSALAANGSAILAFLNTSIAASMAMITWVVFDLIVFNRVKVSAALSGAIAGLVAITPGAGYVEPVGAAVMGAIVALIVYVATTVIKYRLGYDDTLDAFGLHGVGGIAGGLLTGVFATKSLSGHAGLLQGNWALLGSQFLGILVTILISAMLTFIIAKLVSFVTPLRVDEQAEEAGLDLFQHGESSLYKPLS